MEIITLYTKFWVLITLSNLIFTGIGIFIGQKIKNKAIRPEKELEMQASNRNKIYLEYLNKIDDFTKREIKNSTVLFDLLFKLGKNEITVEVYMENLENYFKHQMNIMSELKSTQSLKTIASEAVKNQLVKVEKLWDSLEAFSPTLHFNKILKNPEDAKTSMINMTNIANNINTETTKLYDLIAKELKKFPEK